MPLSKALKTAMKRGLYVFLSASGAEWVRDRIWYRSGRMHSSTLCFHRVTDAIPEDGITISTQRFRTIVRCLARDYHPVPFRQIVEDLHSGRSWRKRTVAVTFDDGYLDNYECAAPVLEEFGVPATFFVTLGFIGSTEIAPWDTHLAGRVAWMDWAKVRELQARGFDIGSHTLTHCDLGKVRGEEARTEISASKLQLQDRLGGEVSLFAFPFGQPGNISEENLEFIRAAGYRGCCSAHGGLTLPGTDPFRIPRVPVTNWFSTPADLHFELRALNPWQWVTSSS